MLQLFGAVRLRSLACTCPAGHPPNCASHYPCSTTLLALLATTQVPLAQLAETEEVRVRAWDDTMNTQPER